MNEKICVVLIILLLLVGCQVIENSWNIVSKTYKSSEQRVKESPLGRDSFNEKDSSVINSTS